MEIPQPISGRISPAIASLVADLLEDVTSEDPNPIAEYFDMIYTSPIVAGAIECKVLLGLAMMGDYSHEDEDIQAFIRSNFENMDGSLMLSVSELMSADPLGFSVAERPVLEKDGQWVLDTLVILDPRNVGFKGTYRGVEQVTYSVGGKDLPIPYDQCIHIVGGRHIAFRRPRGIAACRKAISAWKAWKIVLSELLIATQRQGTGLLVGYAPSEEQSYLVGPDGTTPLKDSKGEPVRVPAPLALLKQLQSAENQSVISTDTKNKIEVLGQTEGRSFFTDVLRVLQQLQLMSFLVPETILTNTGSGDSNLNKGQRTTLTENVRSLVNQIKEMLLERVVRPLIVWNFGEQESYGEFLEPPESEENQVALLSAIAGAVNSGFFSAADLAVQNRGRELAGIPPVTEIVQTITNGRSLNYWRDAA